MRWFRSGVLAAVSWLALWFIPAAQAQAAPPDCPPPPDMAAVSRAQAGQGPDHGLLWRLEKDGRTSWLYGTLHVARPEWLLPGPKVLAALRASDAIALEIDITDRSAIDSALKPDVQAAARVLDAPRLARIEAAASRVCAPTAVLKALSPTMQVMTLSVLEARRLGLYPELAIDAMLAGVARGAGKRLVALESAAQQMGLLKAGSDTEEGAFIDQSLAALESGKSQKMMVRLAEAWARGDEQLLADYPQWCECMDTEAHRKFMGTLLDGRNAAMAQRIAALHGEGLRLFVGVGALHAPGAQGLVALLRQGGFTVTRVPFEPEEKK
jgi:uncharacterized protein YbaP (TraB family)